VKGIGHCVNRILDGDDCVASGQSTQRRNYLLGVLNSVFIQLSMNLSHPSLVLSVFVRALGGSNMLIGLLPAIRFGMWFLPQFLVAGWVQTRRRKLPLAVALEIFRASVYGTLALMAYTLGRSHPTLALLLFFGLFTSTRLTAGIGGLVRLDIIGKIIPSARRASFFATRNMWGGVVVFCAGFLVRYMLDDTRGPAFPINFTLLLGLSCGLFLVATLVLSRIKEPPASGLPPRHSFREQLARAPEMLKRDPSLRRYLLARILLSMTRLSEPFYPVFALDVLGAPASMMGFYLSAMTLAGVLSNLLWQRVGRARGTRFLVKSASLLTVLVPVLAVALPWLLRRLGFTVAEYGLLPAYLFTTVFVVAGSSNSGRDVGLTALLLDTAPAEERPSYIGLVNTVLGFVNFLPILAGAVVDRVGFQPIFFTAAALLLLGYLVMLGWRPAGESRQPETL